MHTICKIDQIEPLVTSRVFEALEPELPSAVCMSPISKSVMLHEAACRGCLPTDET